VIEIGEADPLSEFPFAKLADWLSQGNVVPFVGAGASRAGAEHPLALPDGNGLAAELTRMMPRMAGRAPEALAKVAQVYEHIEFDRGDLYDHLHKRFEVDQCAQGPGPVAEMLARVRHPGAPMFLITTNYDTCIERAFKAAGRPLCVITQNMRDPEHGPTRISVTLPDGTSATPQSKDWEWNEPEVFPDECAFLFKMHGSAHRRKPEPSDDVIITEDDYVDFLVRGGGISSPYFPPASLKRAYKSRRFLFLGYSLNDWNFRAFLRVLALSNALAGGEKKRGYAIQLDADSLEADLWRQRNINLFRGDLVSFCETLTHTFDEARP